MLSESGIASGIRRIEAVAGPTAVEYLQNLDGLVGCQAQGLAMPPGGLSEAEGPTAGCLHLRVHDEMMMQVPCCQ